MCKVGDPKQLPATVLSDVASKYLYQCSMFERLQKAGHPVTMLTKQVDCVSIMCVLIYIYIYENDLEGRRYFKGRREGGK